MNMYFTGLLQNIARQFNTNYCAIFTWNGSFTLAAELGNVVKDELNSKLSSKNVRDWFEKENAKNITIEDEFIAQLNPWIKNPSFQSTSPSPSFLIIPIIGEKPLGVFVVGCNEKLVFSTSDIQRGISDSRIMALTIEKNAQLSSIDRGTKENQLIIEVQKAITSHLELDQVLQLIADVARYLTNTKTTLLMLVDGDSLVTTAISGSFSSDVFIGYRIPIDGSNTGSAVRLRRPVRVLNAWNNPSVFRSDHLRVKSFISVPLIYEDKVLGALMVADKFSGELDDDDERIVSMFAPSAVIAVENARLYQVEQERRLEAEKRRKIAEGFQEIFKIFNSQLAFPEIFQKTTIHIGELLSCDSCYFSIYQYSQQTFEIISRYGSSIDNWKNQRYTINQEELIKLHNLDFIEFSTVPNLNLLSSIERRESTPIDNRCTDDQIQQAVAIPIITEGGLFGEIVIFFQMGHEITTEERLLAKSIRNNITWGLENSRLHKKNEEIARLQERQRIAQSLHDSVAQLLFSLGMEVDQLVQKYNDDLLLRTSFNTIRSLVSRSSLELRSAIFALQEADGQKKTGGVINLIEEMISEFQEKSGIATTFFYPNDFPPISPSLTEVIFRIVRESLSNIAKHSYATAAIVNLLFDNESIGLLIQDDGIGFQEKEENELHFGLSIIRQLVHQKQGELMIRNGDEQGVLIKANFRYPEGENNDIT